MRLPGGGEIAVARRPSWPRTSASPCAPPRQRSRPPAARISARGLVSRKSASARRQRPAAGGSRSPSGVPSMGCRKFTGSDSTRSAASAAATSTRSSSRLAHADDDAGAGRQPGPARALHRRDAVVVGVRAADRRVVAPARVQVVVHVVDAGGPQRARLRVAHDAERDAQLELRQLGADGARRAREVRDVGRARPARARHHAVAPRAARPPPGAPPPPARRRAAGGSARCRPSTPPTASSSRSPRGRARCARSCSTQSFTRRPKCRARTA